MAEPVAVTFLGGLGEIGRNCAVLETDGRRVLLDCGRKFGTEDLPGVESVLPDFNWLLQQGDVEACVATHAHEDHIGALPHLLEILSFPIYGSAFTLGLIHHKLVEAGLTGRAELREVRDGDRYQAGPFECEAMPVTHSVPGGLINAFSTPQGVILHSSDFKLDLMPVDGRRTALSRIGSLAASPGVRLLLADSTNADEPGSSRSETEIGAVLRDLIFRQHKRRVIVAAFASHIHRIQQVADAAIAAGRYVATLGLSMQRNVALARELGLLRVPDRFLLDIADIEALDPAAVLIICTGSQGEPRAALSQMAEGTNKWVSIGADDTVLLSAHPIPGNEVAVAAVRNGLARRGALVLHSGQLDLHTSGHGKQQELQVLHSVAAPQWFVPVHGEYEHLVAHAQLAREMGMDNDRVMLCGDGDRIELTDQGLRMVGSVGGGHIYVQGTVGELGETVLGDRRKLGREGFVVVTVNVDMWNRRIVSRPYVVSRGWVEPPALHDHMVAVADVVTERLSEALADTDCEFEALYDVVLRAARRCSRERTGRKPAVIPVIREV